MEYCHKKKPHEFIDDCVFVDINGYMAHLDGRFSKKDLKYILRRMKELKKKEYKYDAY